MYLRRDRKHLGKKKRVTYLSIAHGITEDSPLGKRSKPIVFANLGNEEKIDQKMAKQLQRSLDKYIEERWGSKPPSKREVIETAREVRKHEPVLRMLATKDLGMRLLLEAAWRELGIGEALVGFAADRRFEFDFERVVFAMVLNRLYDPMSKNACNDWVKNTGFLPEAEGWDVHQFYRAMDVLHEHWNELEPYLEKRILASLDEDQQGLRLVDTTSLYFEARHNDAELATLAERWDAYDADPSANAKPPRRNRPAVVNEPAFRMQGHNKDGHPGDPQVVISSECVAAGYVLRHRTYAGNTNDQTIAKDLVVTLPSVEDGAERVWVSDAGMMSKGLMNILDAAGWHRLSAEGPRKSVLGLSVLQDIKGRFTTHSKKPHLGYKAGVFTAEMTGTGREEMLIATRNEKERERRLDKLAKQISETNEQLARQRSKAKNHPRSMCKVASHMNLGRLVKPSEKVPGTFVLDQEAIRREELLAGVRFYRTTLMDWEAESALAAYGMLQEVEANHRLMKGPLRLRPCYHRTTERIEAHVMLTILAANCVRYLETASGRSYQELVKLFEPMKAIQFDDGRATYWQRSELTPEQTEVLEALQLPVPPRSWEVWIELEKMRPKARKKGPSKRKGRSG